MLAVKKRARIDLLMASYVWMVSSRMDMEIADFRKEFEEKFWKISCSDEELMEIVCPSLVFLEYVSFSDSNIYEKQYEIAKSIIKAMYFNMVKNDMANQNKKIAFQNISGYFMYIDAGVTVGEIFREVIKDLLGALEADGCVSYGDEYKSDKFVKPMASILDSTRVNFWERASDRFEIVYDLEFAADKKAPFDLREMIMLTSALKQQFDAVEARVFKSKKGLFGRIDFGQIHSATEALCEQTEFGAVCAEIFGERWVGEIEKEDADLIANYLGSLWNTARALEVVAKGLYLKSKGHGYRYGSYKDDLAEYEHASDRCNALGQRMNRLVRQ